MKGNTSINSPTFLMVFEQLMNEQQRILFKKMTSHAERPLCPKKSQ